MQNAVLANQGDHAPLLSAQWFRVAGLYPRLDPAAAVDRVVVRGEVWQVLSRHDGRAPVRLNAAAWALIGRLDGSSSIDKVWRCVLADRQDDAPTQDEAMALLTRLVQGGWIAFDKAPDFGRLSQDPRPAMEADPERKQSLLAWRVRLGSPQRLLEPLRPLARWLFSPAALVVWALGVSAAALAALGQSAALAGFLARAWQSPGHWLALWLVFPVMKALHETAHALAVVRFGGVVPDAGFTWMVATPVPYVDASASHAFPAPAHRLVVSLAGVLAETAVAAVALVLALQLSPGALRDVCFVVFFVGAVSSLLVNLNPLLRFDGYHALTDAFALPNLATRSQTFWFSLLRTRLLGLDEPAPVAPALGEKRWWWVYAPSSLLMRWVLAVSVVAWAGSVSRVLGLAVGLLLVLSMLVQPGLRLWRYVSQAGQHEDEARRARRRAAALAAVLTTGLVVVPWPGSLVVEGVVTPGEHAVVRATMDGWIVAAAVQDGQPVTEGDVLFELHDPGLDSARRASAGRLAQLQAQRVSALGSDTALALRVEREWQALEAADKRLAEIDQTRQVRAATTGVVHVGAFRDATGRAVRRGDVLAHVLPARGVPTAARVVVVVDSAQADVWRQAAQASRDIEVRLASTEPRVYQAASWREWGGSGRTLPAAALGRGQGGAIDTDPADAAGLSTVRPVSRFELEIDAAGFSGVHGPVMGTRALVRVAEPARPLGLRALDGLQRLALTEFNAWR